MCCCFVSAYVIAFVIVLSFCFELCFWLCSCCPCVVFVFVVVLRLCVGLFSLFCLPCVHALCFLLIAYGYVSAFLMSLFRLLRVFVLVFDVDVVYVSVNVVC